MERDKQIIFRVFYAHNAGYFSFAQNHDFDGAALSLRHIGIILKVFATHKCR
jgi:hypothetical protein